MPITDPGGVNDGKFKLKYHSMFIEVKYPPIKAAKTKEQSIDIIGKYS
jgi:hypothetical protein